ncbi:MAG: hypothetical protein HYX97_06385 [Chloroflexi bacterium]|nr:hypothetical protein [Chloroflexota bacterium]
MRLRQRFNRELTALLRDMTLSHKKVADVALVSKDTVASWCAGRTRISFDNLETLLAELKSAGTPPERLRRVLLDSVLDQGLSSRLVGEYFGVERAPAKLGVFVIVAWDLRKEIYRIAVHAIQNALSRAGCEVVLLDCYGNSGARRLYLGDLIPSWRPAVIISCDLSSFAGNLNDLDEQTLRLARLGIPVVHFQQRIATPVLKNTAYVGWDNYKIGQAAGRIVVSNTCKTVGLLLAETLQSNVLRHEGFVRALRDAGQRYKIRILRLPIGGDQQAQDRLAKQVSAFIARHRPDAIFAASSGLESVVFRATAPPLHRPLIVAVSFKGEASPATEHILKASCHVLWLPVARACQKTADIALMLAKGLSLSRSERTVLV